MTNELFEKIYALAREVPRGKVTTYGQLGAMCGLNDSRTVGDAMNASPGDVPWQRVINSRGMVSIQGATGMRQRALLEEEGIAFDETGHADLAVFGWVPDTDWLAANGYHAPPPVVKEGKRQKGTARTRTGKRMDNAEGKEQDEGEQLSLF